MRALWREYKTENAAMPARCNDDFRGQPKPSNANRRETLRITSITGAVRFVQLHDNLDGTVGEDAFPPRHQYALEIPNTLHAAMQLRSNGGRPARLNPPSKFRFVARDT